MTILLFITLLFNPFAELEAENEALRSELVRVNRVEMNLRERLRKVNEINDIVRNKLEIKEVVLNERQEKRRRNFDMTSPVEIRGIYIPNDVYYYPREPYKNMH